MSQFLLAVVGCHAFYNLISLRGSNRADKRYQLAVCGGLLALVLAGALIWPRGSGYLIALPWLALLILPGFFWMQLIIAIRNDNSAAIRRSTRWLTALTPSRSWRNAEAIYLVQAATIHGRWADAVALIEANRAAPGDLGERMQISWLSWRHKWAELLAQTGDRVAANADDQAFFGTLRVRALAELHRWDECLATLEEMERWSKHKEMAPTYLAVLALAGQPDPVRRLLKASGDPASPVSEYWLGVAWLAAGDREEGVRILEAAAQAGDSAVKEQVRWRLETARPPELSPAARLHLQRVIAAWPLIGGAPASKG